jgi:hypothetical protein
LDLPYTRFLIRLTYLLYPSLLFDGSITDPPTNKGLDLQKAASKAATGAFAAFTIASSVMTAAPPADATPTFFSSSNMVAEKVVREGMYQDYEVDIVQQVDDARSTFKPAKETKSNKGK